MFRGELVAIYVASAAGAPMQVCTEATLVEGVGIDGDRYANGGGRFSEGRRGGREVTLIEREAVAGAAAEHDLDLAERETRRNLVTEGVPLNHLVGHEFAVGDVVLRGVRLCEPCRYLEQLVGREGVRASLVHRGGLRAEIVRGGVVRTGDGVEAVAGTSPR